MGSDGIGGSEYPPAGGADDIEGDAGDEEEGEEEGASCLPPKGVSPISLPPELPGCLEGPAPNEPDDPEPSEPDELDGEDPPGFAAVWTVAGRFCPCSKDFEPEFA